MKTFIHIFTVILQIFYSLNCFALNGFDASRKRDAQCLAPRTVFPSITIIGASKDAKSDAVGAKKAKADKSLDEDSLEEAREGLERLRSRLIQYNESLASKNKAAINAALNKYRNAFYFLANYYQNLSFEHSRDKELKAIIDQFEKFRSSTQSLLYQRLEKGKPLLTKSGDIYTIPGREKYGNTVSTLYRGYNLDGLCGMFNLGTKGNDASKFENVSSFLFEQGWSSAGVALGNPNFDLMTHLGGAAGAQSGFLSTSSDRNKAKQFATAKENSNQKFYGVVVEIDPAYVEAVFARHHFDSRRKEIQSTDPNWWAAYAENGPASYRNESEISVAREIPAEAIICCRLVDETGVYVQTVNNPNYKGNQKAEAASKDIGKLYDSVEIDPEKSRPATDKDKEIVNKWVEGMKSKVKEISSLYKDYPNVDINKTLAWLNTALSLKGVNITITKINGGEAKFEVKDNKLNIFLDPKKAKESTLFHEMFEAAFSLANPGMQELAHSFTFMTETALYNESMIRKLSNYDDLKLSELIDNTDAEINAIKEAIDSAENDTLKSLLHKKIEQANRIKEESRKILLSRLASPAEGEDNYTLAELLENSTDQGIRNAVKNILVNRLAFLQDGYLSEKSKGGRTIVRNYDLNQESDVRLFAQFFKDMESQTDYLTRNNDYNGMFNMNMGDGKTHLLSGIALSSFDIQALMRNENGWVIEKGDVSQVSSSEKIVNENPRIRLVSENGLTRLRFILSDQNFDLEKIKKSEQKKEETEANTPEEATKSGPAFEDFIRLLKTKSIVFSTDGKGVISRLNPKLNTNEMETYSMVGYQLNLDTFFSGVTSLASLQSIINQKLKGMEDEKSGPVRRAIQNTILETWAQIQKSYSGPSGASKTIGSDISSLMTDTPEGIYFDKQLEDFTAAEKAKLEQFQKNIISRTPAIREALKKLNLDPSLADLIGKAFDMNDPTIRLGIQKAKNGIQGAEAIYFNGMNANGNKTLLMVLDAGFDESTIFHELIESILEDSLADKAHGYTFILESEVYKDSMERKLDNYDAQQLRNIVLNTNSELERLDSLKDVTTELKELKKQNALRIQSLAMSKLSKMSEFSPEKVSERINKLQDEKNIGMTALIRQFKIDNTMDTLKTRLMLTQFLDTIENSSKINKKDYTGVLKYQLSLDKEKLPVSVNGIGLNREDILTIMRNPTFVSFLEGDISKYTGYDMVNGNPHIWHKDGKLFFVLSDQSYTMTEIERTRNLESSLENEMKTNEVEKATNGAAFADFLKILKSKSINLYRQGNGYIFHVNERKNTAQKQQYDLIDAGLDFTDISDNVSFNTLKELLSRKINTISDANKRKLMEAGLQKLVLDTWATVQKINGLQAAGASKTIGAVEVSSSGKTFAPVTDVVFTKLTQYNGITTVDDKVPERFNMSDLKGKQKNYAEQAYHLMKMLNNYADSIAESLADRKVISSSQTSEVSKSVFAQLTKALTEGNGCDLKAPILLNSFIKYQVNPLTSQKFPSLVLQVGDTLSSLKDQDLKWKNQIINKLFLKMSGVNTDAVKADTSLNTDMFVLMAANEAIKKAVGSIEGQEIRRTNDFLFANMFDVNSNPLNDSAASVQFSA